jgi:polyisoprenoid-binding protein YceI
MRLQPGTHALSPADGTLTVLTGRGGAAAKAGHDLTIEVTRWRGTIDVGEAVSLSLTADARSLRVREGSGGMKDLDDEDKAGIARTIDEDVLKGTHIEFRSSSVAVSGSRLEVAGELELMGVRRPLEFALNVDDGRLTGSAMVKQTDWRMKPFSALFGTLKVADVVEVQIDARIPAAVGAARGERHG